MKILINCYACSPYKGSEPGMGWNFVRCLSKMHELHIITESKFQPDLEKYFAEHPEDRKACHFYFIRKERHKKLRKIWPPSYYWFYRKWQKEALRLARELDSKEHFDLVHHLNMVGFREPGYLWRMDKPLVWGPTGGMHQSPWVLLPYIGFYGMLYYGIRNILNLKDIYLKKLPRKMAERSNVIIAATQDAHDAIKDVWKKDSVIIPEVGLVDSALTECNDRDWDGNLKIVWTGQHTPAKALNFLLEALSQCRNASNMELHVLGQGKYTNRWKKMAAKMGVDNIIWHGRIPRDQAIDIMKSCDVLCITSLADLTSSVLLEGLSYGLPVIALNRFGFANAITDECGIKIDIYSKKQVVNDYAKSLDLLYEDTEKRQALSKGAYERAKAFSWDHKAKIIDEIYTKIVNQ